MLNKIRIGLIVGAILSALKFFLPEIDIAEGLQDAILLVIVFVTQFFVRETTASLESLSLKR